MADAGQGVSGRLLEKREKLTYALMAASGACLGYGMTQVKDLQPSLVHFLLVLALLLWVASFWFGYKKVVAEIDCLWHEGILESIQNLPAEHRAANARSHNESMQEQLRKIEQFSQRFLQSEKLQVWTLIGGVALYGFWQALMMFCRPL